MARKPATLTVPKKKIWTTLAKVKATRSQLAGVDGKPGWDEYRVHIYVASEAAFRKIAKAAGYSKEQMWRILGI